VHTTNTFRTQPDAVGPNWRNLATRAVDLTANAVPSHHRIAGAIAPIADCYRPDLSPANPRLRHAELAQVLAKEGVDILLCETFPHVGEALAATAAAIETGIETWVSFTAGPDGTLLTPEDIRSGAEQAVALGASAVLVNCTPASQTARFLTALTDLGVPFGAYANAGHPDEGLGWVPSKDGPERYADHAESWVELGATLLGSCCGTGPQHIQILRQRFCE
jgi:S-methylmethionine-dependent homocysteine/selenocysteine methylase